MNNRLGRIEKIIAGDEPITNKQANLLILDVLSGMYRDFEPAIKQVPKNTTALKVLRTRVNMGIGLTVLVGLTAAVIILVGG